MLYTECCMEAIIPNEKALVFLISFSLSYCKMQQAILGIRAATKRLSEPSYYI